MAVNQNIELKPPAMSSYLIFLLDKWAIVGFGGMALNLASLFQGAELPEFTGFSGLLIVGVAIYQKVRDDRRTQQKHNMQLKVIEAYLKKEIEIDETVIKEFMAVDEK